MYACYGFYMSPLYLLDAMGMLAEQNLTVAAGGACALYCNIKLAKLTIINGKRFVRFRDISNEVFGKSHYRKRCHSFASSLPTYQNIHKNHNFLHPKLGDTQRSVGANRYV